MTLHVVPTPARDIEPVSVNPVNFREVTRHLPFTARKALGYAVKLTHGKLTVCLPDGSAFAFTGSAPGPVATFEIRDFGFAARLAESGDLGFAEAYLQGEWDTPDLAAFLLLFAANHVVVQTLLAGRPLVRLWQMFRHFLNRNTKSGSRKNIQAHYDLGNDFYSAWLDKSMTYSSALYEAGDNDLSAGQLRKYRELARRTHIGPDDHVLEIGCGWGGFAEFAASEIGCRVTGLTISQEQYTFARERIARAGLQDKVTIKLQDYRDERGIYDRIASIEMFEAVGEAYWPVYFKQLQNLLRPGGTAGVQVITIREEMFKGYQRELDFIRAYIFPGGMLPTPGIMKSLGDRFGLPLTGDNAFGLDYASTLVAWRERFRAAWPTLVPMGFDERFRRMWEYYFAYCEAGFRTGNIDVRQMIFAKAS
jgi:cyclopropane-fatty-acyl-phospholipid synthase